MSKETEPVRRDCKEMTSEQAQLELHELRESLRHERELRDVLVAMIRRAAREMKSGGAELLADLKEALK